jgi:hypothetical protein
MYTDNRIISLNSKYAQLRNGTLKSDVVFNFKGIVKDDDNIVQKYITIIDAQIPVSFYTINNSNKVLTVVLGANTYTLNITNGNYNASTLITELITKIATIPALTATIVINKSTGKLTFTFSSAVTLVFSTSTIASILGLTANLTGTSITLQQPLNLLGIKKLNIKSNALAVSNFSSENLGNASILLSIPNNEAQFNMISFNNQNNLNNCVLNADTVDIIDIQIVDETNTLIDFNNQDWSMTLGISIERERLVKFDHNLIDAIQTAINPKADPNSDLIKQNSIKEIDPELQLLES